MKTCLHEALWDVSLYAYRRRPSENVQCMQGVVTHFESAWRIENYSVRLAKKPAEHQSSKSLLANIRRAYIHLVIDIGHLNAIPGIKNTLGKKLHTRLGWLQVRASLVLPYISLSCFIRCLLDSFASETCSRRENSRIERLLACNYVQDSFSTIETSRSWGGAQIWDIKQKK